MITLVWCAWLSLMAALVYFQMTFVMCLAFLISWGPYAVLSLWYTFGGSSSIPYLVSVGPPVFAKSSTWINPIVYFLAVKRFRNEMKAHVFCCSESKEDNLVSERKVGCDSKKTVESTVCQSSEDRTTDTAGSLETGVLQSPLRAECLIMYSYSVEKEQDKLDEHTCEETERLYCPNAHNNNSLTSHL